jgi:hypothetical protein
VSPDEKAHVLVHACRSTPVKAQPVTDQPVKVREGAILKCIKCVKVLFLKVQLVRAQVLKVQKL